MTETELTGSTEGMQLHAWLRVGEELRLKVVWRTSLWFQVVVCVMGLDGLRAFGSKP